MSFQFSIPTPTGDSSITIEPGSSVIFVGANGGGKTRLAVHIEDTVGISAHRISAHRALNLNGNVPKVSEQEATSALRLGAAVGDLNVGYRAGNRWKGQAATFLLDDFDFLIQALFAEQTSTALKTHRANRVGDHTPAKASNFERLAEIWNMLLPHRELVVTDQLHVSTKGWPDYVAARMSDGERAIFYMIGQVLAADRGTLLLVDEPELHVHRSIMSKLWDELEAKRPDCSFVFITHDLEFAAMRVAQKFVITDYDPTPRWTIEAVPDDTGFSEEVTTLILGSRRPILFVEGDESSLDNAFYRCCYPEWTIIPRGSCEEVIHAVVTFRKNSSLTRILCSGIVDADHYTEEEKETLEKHGIAMLAVAEIENLVLLPEVSRAIAVGEGYKGKELEECLSKLESDIRSSMNKSVIDDLTMRYCKRPHRQGIEEGRF